jgi:hypothetical protein
MENQISRGQMLKAVWANVAGRRRADAGYNSFAERGNTRRLQIALALYVALLKGYVPSTQEVVAYFGPGARFEA